MPATAADTYTDNSPTTPSADAPADADPEPPPRTPAAGGVSVNTVNSALGGESGARSGDKSIKRCERKV